MSVISSAASNIGAAARGAIGGALNPVHSARVMGRLIRRMRYAPGTAPGVLTHVGPKKVDRVRVRLMEYDGDRLREEDVPDVAATFGARDNPPVSWVNIDGLHDTGALGQLRDHFDLHLLVMEGVVSVGQRAKTEEYDGYLFLVVPMLSFNEETRTVEAEQLSLILGPNWVLTFQERPGDVFEPVRERLRAAYGRIRQKGADYLAYALLDAVVDRYFLIMERLGDVAEDLDQRIMEDPAPEILHQVSALKRELLLLRKSIWPLREALGTLMRTESTLVGEATQVFVRDVYDHAVQAIDTVETLREMAASMMDHYLSSLGQRTNDVMKVLTIMASIFIPLTFMAGIYGMNFEFMPELSQPWAYPALWLAMILVAGGMIAFFKKRGWF